MTDELSILSLTDQQKADFIAVRTILYKIADINEDDIMNVMKAFGESDENLCLSSAQEIVNFIEYLGTICKLPYGVFSELSIFK